MHPFHLRYAYRMTDLRRATVNVRKTYPGDHA